MAMLLIMEKQLMVDCALNDQKFTQNGRVCYIYQYNCKDHVEIFFSMFPHPALKLHHCYTHIYHII